MHEAPDLVRLLSPIEKHEPAHESVLRLRDEANRMHSAFPQIPVDEEKFDMPRDDALDNDGDSSISSESVWEQPQSDRSCSDILSRIHSCGCVSIGTG